MPIFRNGFMAVWGMVIFMKRLGSILCILGLLMMSGCYQHEITQSSSEGENSTSLIEGDSTGTSATSTRATGTTSSVTTGGETQTGSTIATTVITGATTQAETSAITDADTGNTTTTAASEGTDNSADGEFRGVWVSFIEITNMLKGKTVDEAKAALDSVMDNAKSYGLNAVIFHVRANSDAYYNSSIFNVASGVSSLVSEGFDPLAYAVEAAHSRGLELHAWINPYRIGTNTGNAKCSDYFGVTNDSGTTSYYYNPASDAVRTLILNGIGEIIDNYDVDGVQFDDYFYPNDPTVIPTSEAASFEKTAYTDYIQNGGTFSIGDWRRLQVDTLVNLSYYKVHEKNCVFGISPSYNVTKNYNNLYADVAKWTANSHYVDYICPQIYFGFENSTAPFDTTVASWVSMNRDSSVKLYIGLALYKIGLTSDANAGAGQTEWAEHDDIMKRSVEVIRSQQACSGMIFYNYSGFTATTDIGTREIQNLLSIL